MRISSLQAFNNGLQGIQRNYADAIRTQQQINSANRILTPADDPVASVRLLQLDQQQNMLAQYKGNLSAANSSLAQEESALNSVNNIMLRVREIAGEAGNGALSQADRQSLAVELQEREDELLGLMNTRDARGEYMFGGFQGKTQPFERAPDGSYTYQGDDGQRKIQIGSSLNIAIGDSGKQVFENIPNAARLKSELATPVPAGSSLAVSQPLVQDEINYSGDPAFPANGVEVRFADPAAVPPGDPKDYAVYASPYTDGDEPLQSGRLDNDEGRPDTLTFRGVVMQFEGEPAGGERIQVEALPNSEKQGVLNTIAQLRMALEDNTDSPQGKRDTRDAVAAALSNIDHAMVNIDSTRGSIGARMNVIETTLNNNEEVALVNKSVQAELREIDYPEALSKLAFQSIVLEAAQQSFVKVSQLNLFDKIR